MTETIYAWDIVASDYRNGLVLGNGASIAFDRRFSYRSLREEAARRDLIPPDVQLVFDKLDTTNFELVLRVLWHVTTVNDALGLQERRTARAYISVKKALIEVVRAIHPDFSEVNDRLTKASKFMQRFQTVIALNYDSLVYWAMQVGNENRPNRFKDCFISSDFQHDWQRFREPYGDNKRATLVFYPHGNIVLGTDILGTERKISSRDFASLLETILEEWRKGKNIPLFVSEGTTDQKRTSIRRSPYLSTVFEEVLPAIGSTSRPAWLVFGGG